MSKEEQDFSGQEDINRNRYLTFYLGSEAFGIEIGYVNEIISIQPIIEIPDQPEFVKGIINLRGQITAVVDARLRFGKPVIEYGDRTCIIVIKTDKNPVGLIVDNISEVLSIPETETVKPPDISCSKFINSIVKTENEIILILNCQTLINTENTIYKEIGVNADEMVFKQENID